jgi:dephospho-CoA kinase
MPYTVGVTGGIGSGKSALTDRLEAFGITVVDADQVARVVVEPGRSALTAIAEHFGGQILLPDGNLDRAALRQRVFADEAQRLWLEALLHPLIRRELRARLKAAVSPYVVLSSPLLLETDQDQLVDLVVVVDVPEALQLERAMARDGNSEAQIRRIMQAQMPRDQRLSKADFVIDNSATLAQLEARAATLHRDILARIDHATDRHP